MTLINQILETTIKTNEQLTAYIFQWTKHSKDICQFSDLLNYSLSKSRLLMNDDMIKALNYCRGLL